MSSTLHDPRAQRSRRDLRRVHRAMGSLTILKAIGVAAESCGPPKAHHGTRRRRRHVAAAARGRIMRPGWKGVEVTLLDRHPAVAPNTLDGFHRLAWQVNVVCEDALQLGQATGMTKRYDLCIAHFVSASF